VLDSWPSRSSAQDAPGPWDAGAPRPSGGWPRQKDRVGRAHERADKKKEYMKNRFFLK